MHPHPLIHADLARQREGELRRRHGGLHRRPPVDAAHEDDYAPTVLDARSGCERAWETLVARFTPTLRNVVHGYRLSSADVDDVVQTAWASAFSHLGGLRDPDAFAGWLCVIARREALRTIRRRQSEVLVDEPRFPDQSDHATPESALLDAEEHDVLHTAVKRLPDRQRTLLDALLRDSATSYADISRTLGLPLGAIGPTRERALARLRRDRVLTAVASHSLSETSS
jgi:RNA polymerase sigma factor (sigma-70 family)